MPKRGSRKKSACIGSIELGVIRKCRKRDLDPNKPGHKECLYTKDGKKLLGRHRTHASALRQERAIQVNKRRGKKKVRK